MSHVKPMANDADDALKVLEWAREHSVPVAAVTCGGCTVTLFEVRAVGEKREKPARGGLGIYEQLGGEVWKHAVSSGDIEGPGHAAKNGEDLVPGIGDSE